MGARFGGVGALVILPGKIRGKSTPKCRANSMAKCRANSMAIPRLISEAKSRKSVKIVENDETLKSVFLGTHLVSGVVPYWKMSDFGGVEVSRLAEAWLAGPVC